MCLLRIYKVNINPPREAFPSAPQVHAFLHQDSNFAYGSFLLHLCLFVDSLSFLLHDRHFAFALITSPPFSPPLPHQFQRVYEPRSSSSIESTGHTSHMPFFSHASLLTDKLITTGSPTTKPEHLPAATSTHNTMSSRPTHPVGGGQTQPRQGMTQREENLTREVDYLHNNRRRLEWFCDALTGEGRSHLWKYQEAVQRERQTAADLAKTQADLAKTQADLAKTQDELDRQLAAATLGSLKAENAFLKAESASLDATLARDQLGVQRRCAELETIRADDAVKARDTAQEQLDAAVQERDCLREELAASQRTCSGLHVELARKALAATAEKSSSGGEVSGTNGAAGIAPAGLTTPDTEEDEVADAPAQPTSKATNSCPGRDAAAARRRAPARGGKADETESTTAKKRKRT